MFYRLLMCLYRVYKCNASIMISLNYDKYSIQNIINYVVVLNYVKLINLHCRVNECIIIMNNVSKEKCEIEKKEKRNEIIFHVHWIAIVHVQFFFFICFLLILTLLLLFTVFFFRFFFLQSNHTRRTQVGDIINFLTKILYRHWIKCVYAYNTSTEK